MNGAKDNTVNQLEFPSLDFPGRTALYPFEIAERIGCHVDHVHDLVEEGQLRGVDISGRNNVSNRRCLRIPIESWREFIKARTI